MESGTLDIKEHLLHSNEEFRRLAKKHTTYNEQLEKLIHKSHLNDDERIEEVNLKKKKLQVKDQMEAMIQKFRQRPASSSSTGPLG